MIINLIHTPNFNLHAMLFKLFSSNPKKQATGGQKNGSRCSGPKSQTNEKHLAVTESSLLERGATISETLWRLLKSFIINNSFCFYIKRQSLKDSLYPQMIFG